MTALVVGAAIVRGRRVLAARRTRPPEAAGRWELPGGKVEPGETPAAAVVREVQEELGLAIALRGWLDVVSPIVTASGAALELRIALAVAAGGAEPAPTEHDQVRWLGVHELGAVDWLEPDRPFLPALARVLGILGGVRGIFFEEGHARAAVRALESDGYTAEAVRERLAGEDDDEDQPWAVLTDAPEFVLDVLVDSFDGWLDLDEPEGESGGLSLPKPPPLVLPRTPKRGTSSS